MNDKNLYQLLRPIVGWLMKKTFHPEIIYEEEIPKNDKIILAGNHIHLLDSVLLSMATDRNIYVLAKNELFKGPFRAFFNSLGCIPVDRSGNGLASIREALISLEEGKCIGIFPEGTRNKTDKIILPFKLGTVVIAKRSKTDIIPFSITGKYKLINNNLKLTIGKRICVKDYSTEDLLNKVEDDVKSLILKNR